MRPSFAKPCVYRHYNDEGELLYVGTSVNPLTRLYDHQLGSRWFDDIAYIEIEHFETIDQAMVAETHAITEERPLYNGMLRPYGMKLTDPQIAELRSRYLSGEKTAALAKEFGVTAGYISQLAANKYRKRR
jgi:excinuclease UvrABC nuclease subunit